MDPDISRIGSLESVNEILKEIERIQEMKNEVEKLMM